MGDIVKRSESSCIAAFLAVFLSYSLPFGLFAANHAVSLDGDGDGIYIPSAASNALGLSPTNSMALWLSFAEVPTSGRHIVLQKADTLVTNVAYQFEFDGQGGGTGSFRIDYGDAQRHYTTTRDWEAQTWYHLAFTHDGTVGRWYVNGSLDSTTTNGTVHRFGTNAFYIGMAGASPTLNDWPGLLDEISMWTEALSPVGIIDCMLGRIQGKERGVVGYWNFDSLSAIDQSTSTHQGTIVGDAFFEPHRPPSLNDADQVEVGLIPTFPTSVHTFQYTTTLTPISWIDVAPPSPFAGMSKVRGMPEDCDVRFYRAIRDE